jgi:ribosomal-protein-alanine N-acetyltransferase
MRIERLRWWHIEEIVPIEGDLFGAEQWSAGMFWNELANGHHYVVAVETAEGEERACEPRSPGSAGSAGTVAGYAGLAAGVAGEAWVQNIAVRRDVQRRGIGRVLLEALLAEAARRGAGRVLLEVATDNDVAQRLYERYGFEPVTVRRGYYQPSNTDALVMMRIGAEMADAGQ